MEDDKLAAHIRSREELLLDPAVRRNHAQVEGLLCEDFQEFGASGTVWTREQIVDRLATEIYQPPSVEDFHCHPIADGVVLVTYRAVRTDPNTNEQTAKLRSSVWTENSGVWRLRFHQGTRVV